MSHTLKKYKFRVTHIVDGDTIKGVFLIPRWWAWRPAEVEDKIRFVGMNTPEIGKGNEQEAAERAKFVVFSYLDGKTITVQIALRAHSHDWVRGDFNRVLGLVFMPYREMTLNEFLLREGHARLFKFPEWMPKQITVRFQNAEKKAKAKKKGIWKSQRPKQRQKGKTSRWFWWICAIIAWVCVIVVFFA